MNLPWGWIQLYPCHSGNTRQDCWGRDLYVRFRRDSYHDHCSRWTRNYLYVRWNHVGLRQWWNAYDCHSDKKRKNDRSNFQYGDPGQWGIQGRCKSFGRNDRSYRDPSTGGIGGIWVCVGCLYEVIFILGNQELLSWSIDSCLWARSLVPIRPSRP